jgi:hypothetical protein
VTALLVIAIVLAALVLAAAMFGCVYTFFRRRRRLLDDRIARPQLPKISRCPASDSERS